MPAKIPAETVAAAESGAPPGQQRSAAPDGATQPLVAARVAPGRTVHVGEQRFGPGATLHLWAEEVARLGALGFVLSADAPAGTPRASAPSGATVQVEDGTQVASLLVTGVLQA